MPSRRCSASSTGKCVPVLSLMILQHLGERGVGADRLEGLVERRRDRDQVHDLLARRLEALAGAGEAERVDRLGLDRAGDDDGEDDGDERRQRDLVAAGGLEEQEDRRERRVRTGAEERRQTDQRIGAARAR